MAQVADSESVLKIKALSLINSLSDSFGRLLALDYCLPEYNIGIKSADQKGAFAWPRHVLEFLCAKHSSVMHILGHKCVGELAVPEFTILHFVEAIENQMHLVNADSEAQVEE